MTSKTSNQSQPIQVAKQSNETGFDFPLSPSEPGKFDFYRVHLTNQGHKQDSMFSDNYEASNPSTEIPIRWTPFSHMKHLTDQSKMSSSSSALYSPTTNADDLSINTKILNKPIQTVASFSTLTDAVKNAMQKGNIMPSTNQLRRPTSGTTLSTKDLNHLSPQSM